VPAWELDIPQTLVHSTCSEDNPVMTSGSEVQAAGSKRKRDDFEMPTWKDAVYELNDTSDKAAGAFRNDAGYCVGGHFVNWSQ